MGKLLVYHESKHIAYSANSLGLVEEEFRYIVQNLLLIGMSTAQQYFIATQQYAMPHNIS